MKKHFYIAPFIFSLLLLMLQQSPAHADGIKNEGFILNKGQWPDSILSRAVFPFGDVILQKDGIVFFLRDKDGFHDHQANHVHTMDTMAVIHAHAYKMKFKGGDLSNVKGLDPSVFNVNFIKGNDPAKWAGNLFCYKKLIIENLYKYIDLVLYVTDAGIKYDLVLKENARIDRIAIEYEGLDSMYLDKEGNLQLKTSLGNVTEKMPIAFIEKNEGSKAPVLCQYALKDNTVHFKTSKISKNKQENLVIDPELIFATYSGSTADNWGNSATYDSTGNFYAAGIAFNWGFPATIGAFQINFASIIGTIFNPPFFLQEGDPDVAILKFSPNGSLLYATYLGGGRTEVPTSVIVNQNNELYILGTTSSGEGFGSAFPTTLGAYDQTFNGGSDIKPLGTGRGIYYDSGSDLFVAKLNANGSGLLASTFIGGSGNDGLMQETEALSRNYSDQFRSEILLDSLNFVYIASHTQSNDILNPGRPGYDLTYNGGGRDGIVIKMTPNLDDIVWNTYWGGNGLDACYSLQFGINNDLFVTGGTTSTNLATDNGLNSLPIGDVDGFVLKLSTTNGSLERATYLGTTSTDQGYFLQTDHMGFVYILGQSRGNYPIVNAAYANPSSQQFIHKLNPELNQTIFSTQIGSGQNKIDLVPTAFLVNDCENIFVAGWGGASNSSSSGTFYQGGNTFNLPIHSNAFQQTTDGSDFYLMVLKKDMQKILYSTYFGGSGINEHVDGGTCRFDKKGIVYESVCACIKRDRFWNIIATPDFPVSSNAYSSTIGSTNCNHAVFKFDLSSLKADFTVDTTKLCGSGPVTFTNNSLGGVSFLWNLGDGTIRSSSTSFTHTYQQPGTYTVQLIATDEATCIGKDTAEKTIEVIVLPDIELGTDNATICKGDTTQLNTPFNANYSYLWSPPQFIIDPAVHDPRVFPPFTMQYTVLVTDLTTMCENKDTVLVKVFNPVPGIAYENLTGCQGAPNIRVGNSSGPEFNYLWDFGDGVRLVGEQNQTYTYSSFGQYTLSLRVFNDLCEATDTLTIQIPEVKIPNLITPNNDQLNDTYVIAGMNNNWKLDIYNRWGNLVYTREPYDQSWGAEGLSEGVYYYLISDPQGNKCKGWVHVLK